MHFRTSRSPSSKTSRKRRHSSSASSISSISSIGNEKEKEDRLQKANAEVDALVEEFLNEEKKLVDKFDVDKKHYLDFPDKHREYTSEWNYFYKKRYYGILYTVSQKIFQKVQSKKKLVKSNKSISRKSL